MVRPSEMEKTFSKAFLMSLSFFLNEEVLFAFTDILKLMLSFETHFQPILENPSAH